MDGLKEQPSLGCFVAHEDVRVKGEALGPLNGLTFAVKDLYDVAGFVTGGGNPDYLRTHAAPADTTAPPILQLLDAGADLEGKTITDDLACGMFGENIHYGTPLNPKFPELVPGGSSSGSVSAVAGGAVDFAVGTDTGGSIRVPASFCGIYGLRPSHGRISMAGCIPMAPSFDSCGWFARDLEMLGRVGDILLPQEADRPFSKIAFAADVLDWVKPEVAEAFRGLAGKLGVTEAVKLYATSPEDYIDTFWTLMSRQVWNSNGRWYRREDPTLATGLADRFDDAAKITGAANTQAEAARRKITTYLSELLEDGTVVLMPTTHDIAPRLQSSPEVLTEFRTRNLGLITIGSLGRLPQITIPAMEFGDGAVGLSMIGKFGSDRTLIDFAKEIEARLAAA